MSATEEKANDTAAMPKTTDQSANQEMTKVKEENVAEEMVKVKEEEVVEEMANASIKAADVFAIPELLENILYHLDMRTLLLAQRVGQEFAAQIQTSPKLQRALFFRPEEPGTTPTYEENDGNLVHGQLSPCGYHSRVRGAFKIQQVQLNPLLLDAFPWLATNPDVGLTQYDFSDTPWADATDAFRRHNASWRRMLLSQPPATSLFIDDHRPGGEYKRELARTAKWDMGADGLRMGSMYDLVYTLILERGKQRESAFMFMMMWPGYWHWEQSWTTVYTDGTSSLPLAQVLKRKGIVMPLTKDGELVFACRSCSVSEGFEFEEYNVVEDYKSEDTKPRLGIRWVRKQEPLCTRHYPWVEKR